MPDTSSSTPSGATLTPRQNTAPDPTTPQEGATASSRPQSDNLPQKTQPAQRLSGMDMASMLVVAVLLDLIGIIPFIGWVVSPLLGVLTFGIWFTIKKIPLISPKKVASWGISLLGEMVPAINSFLPGVTIGIALVILITYLEDKTGLDVMSLAKGNVSGIANVGKNIAEQAQTRLRGATPTQTPTVKPPENKGTTSENPVTTSERKHYAAANQTPTQQGATPTPQQERASNISQPKPQTPRRDLVDSSRDEEVAVGMPRGQSVDGIRNTPRSNTTGGKTSNEATPFPGAPSPHFGNTSDRTSNPQQTSDSIKDQAQQERGEILGDFFTAETLSNGANLLPFAGGGKMIVESLAGKEAYGKELTGKERIIHGAIGAASLGLDFTGAGEAGKGVAIVGKSAVTVEKMGARLAEKGAAKSARVFSRTAKFMADNPELTKLGEEYAEKRAQKGLKDMAEYRGGKRPAPDSPQSS